MGGAVGVRGDGLVYLRWVMPKRTPRGNPLEGGNPWEVQDIEERYLGWRDLSTDE